MSMTPLKPLPWCQWHRWNFRPDPYICFRGVIDTAEIVSSVSMTPLKPPWSWNEKYYMDFNHKIFFAEFQRCHWHRWNRFRRLSKRLSRRIWTHMRNGFSLLIRDRYGVDWWKKTESRKSRDTVPSTKIWHLLPSNLINDPGTGHNHIL
jgi:hypothetical protein